MAGINQNNKKSLSGLGRALFCGPDLWSPLAGPFARLGGRACPAGGYFSMMKSSKRFLGRVCGRLAAGRRFCRVQSRYAYPAGAYFCMRKSRQNALGAVPQDPLAAKLRLDTNWTFQQMLKSRSVRRRRYALKVPAAHYMWGNCKSAAESYHRKACASLSNEGNELKNFPHSRSVNVEDCGEYIAGFGFQCYRLTSFLSVRPSR